MCMITQPKLTVNSNFIMHGKENMLSKNKTAFAFTLVEMLLALLVVSVILSASLPVISSRQKAVAQDVNQNVGMPVGGIILWTDMETLPDNTWLECDGSALPTGIEYEQARRVFGDSLPDLRDVRNNGKN